MFPSVTTCQSFGYGVVENCAVSWFTFSYDTYFLTYLITYLLTHSLTYSLTYLLTYLLIYLLTNLLTYSLTPLLTHSLTYSLTCLFTYLLTYLLTHSLTYSLTYSLTDSLVHCMQQSPSWEALGSQLVKKFPAFYGTRKFITAFTSARYLSLSWASSLQSMPPFNFLKIHLNITLPSTSGCSK